MTRPIDDFLPVLEKWFNAAMAQVYSQPQIPGPGILLMGCPVWGPKYLDRFQSYCLPSIASTKNFNALQGRCHMVLFTDQASFARLVGLARTLEGGGITTQVLIIPGDVMAHLPRDPLNRYWVLGVVGNLLLQMAGRMGAAFHMLMPDHLYAHEYFPNLWRLSVDHRAIVQPGISADITRASIDIEPHRNEDGNLAISDRDLGTIGWRHLHRQTRACLMNAAHVPTHMPNSHLLIWQGRDKLVLHCPHMNPAYLAPEITAKAPPRIPATIDAELPAFIGATPIYVPKIDDGMTYLELSDGEKLADEGMVDFATFSEGCVLKVRGLSDWDAYFEQPYEIPIAEQQTFVADETIREDFRIVYDGIIADRPYAALRFLPRLAFQSPT